MRRKPRDWKDGVALPADDDNELGVPRLRLVADPGNVDDVATRSAGVDTQKP